MMKKTGLSIALIMHLVMLPKCKQNIENQENLLNSKAHITDSIIYTIPKSTRLCDEMKVEKKQMDIGDCKLYCEIEGEGAPLVLIHGGPGGTHHCFHPWLSQAKDKFKIIYYDQRGCGQSEYKPGEGYSFEQTVDDLEKLRIALKIDKWIVFGHSFGGAVAQYYTIKYPQNVLGMILVGSVPMMNKPELDVANENWASSDQEKAKYKQIIDLIMAGKLSYAQYFYNDAINGGWKRQNFLKPKTERFAQLATYDIVFDDKFNSDYNIYNFEHAFETCPVPTLLCEGKYDSLWSSEKVPLLKKNHPNARFVSFEKSSHNIYSDEPEKLIETISEWTKELKSVDDFKITEWKNRTNELLGEQLQLIQNNKDFIKLIKNEGIEAAQKFYETFKKSYPGKTLFFENSINRLAYQYMRNKKLEEAITLFELNVKAYPESWNVYDSLAEAYMNAGKKDLAIKNYKKSLELNPENTNAIEQLKNLKSK